MRYLSTLLTLLALILVPALALAEDAATSSAVPWAEIITAAGTVLALLITWGGKLLRELIKAKVKNETLNGVLYRAEREVEEIVLALEQTLRPSLGAKLADGKLDDDEKAAIKAEALAVFKDTFQWADLVSVAFGGNEAEAEAKVERQIKTSVKMMKAKFGPSVTPGEAARKAAEAATSDPSPDSSEG